MFYPTNNNIEGVNMGFIAAKHYDKMKEPTLVIKAEENKPPEQVSNFLINRDTGVYHVWTAELATAKDENGRRIMEPYDLPGAPKFKKATLPIPKSEIMEFLTKEIFGKHNTLVTKASIITYIKDNYNEELTPDDYTKEDLFIKIYNLRQERDE